MRRLMLAAAAAITLLAGACTRSPGDEQALVDRATLTVQEMMTSMGQAPRDMMRKAKAVMICPRVFKAGFLAAGEGGSCVLLSRSGNGTWSYPAFYGLGSGSFGLQIGIQDAQLVLMILTDKGLSAVVDHQFKFGANASITVATIGAEVEGATTTAVGADIVAYAISRGLFGGVALEGSVMSTRTSWNQAYYGQPFAARQIVIQMQGVNPGADPLRQVLTRYGSAAAPMAAPAQAPVMNAPGMNAPGMTAPPTNTPGMPPPSASQYAPPQTLQPPATPSYTPPSGDRGPLQQENLSAPAR